MQSTVDDLKLTSLVGASQIAHRVEEMARDIAGDFSSDLVLLAILKNGFVFAADLLRALGRTGARVSVDFVCPTGGEPMAACALDLSGRDVLVVDAILDTGRTAMQTISLARRAGAADVRLAVLLDRPSRQSFGPTADYTGFILPDRYVVGYGIDRDGAYRERCDVAAID